MTEQKKINFKALSNNIKGDFAYRYGRRIETSFTDDVLHALDEADNQQNALNEAERRIAQLTHGTLIFTADEIEQQRLGTEWSMPSAQHVRIAHPPLTPGVTYPEKEVPGATWNVNAGDFIDLPPETPGVIARVKNKHEGIRVFLGRQPASQEGESEQEVIILQIIDGERVQTKVPLNESTDTVDASVIIFENTIVDPLENDQQREQYVQITSNHSIPPSVNISLRRKASNTDWPLA